MFLPIIGLEVGVLLVYLEYFCTAIHGVQPDIWLYFIQLLFAHSVYATDRYYDFLQTPELDEKGLYISTHKDQILFTTTLSSLMAVALLLSKECYEFIVPYLTCIYAYRDIKRNVPFVKPLIVASAFIMSSAILPCYAMQHDLSIFEDYHAWTPAFFEMLASTNIKDIKDVEEDEKNDVLTFPVVVGSRKANTVSLIAYVASFTAVGIPKTPIKILFDMQLFANTMPAIRKFIK